MATKHNTNNMDFPVITSFDHQGLKVVRILREMRVHISDHLGITTRKGIYQRWVLIEEVLKGPDLTKFRNGVLACK